MRRGRRLVLGPLSPRLSLVAPPFVHRPRTVAWAARARLRKEGEGWETMEERYVGVDVSKDRLDVHVLPEGAAFAVARDGKGLAELVERLSALQPQRIAVEATGGFETIVAAALAGASLPLGIVNPAQVRHFAQALGRRAKTDPIDASMMARFGEGP